MVILSSSEEKIQRGYLDTEATLFVKMQDGPQYLVDPPHNLKRLLDGAKKLLCDSNRFCRHRGTMTILSEKEVHDIGYFAKTINYDKDVICNIYCFHECSRSGTQAPAL